jgi:hypothetical protein
VTVQQKFVNQFKAADHGQVRVSVRESRPPAQPLKNIWRQNESTMLSKLHFENALISADFHDGIDVDS